MDYSAIVSAAWRITRRFPGLWVLGLFAGSVSGSLSLYTGGGGSAGDTNFGDTQAFDLREVSAVFAQALAQLQEYLSIIAIGIGVLFVIYVLFWLLSILCKGSLIAGAGGAEAEQPVSLGWAWGQGKHAFGRLFLLDLVLYLIGLAIFLIFAASAIQSLRSLASPRVGLSDLLGSLAPLFGFQVLLSLLGSVLGVVVGYAQRAIVLDGTSTMDGVRAAIALTRQWLGTSLVLWLLGAVLSVAGGLALVLALFVLLIPVGIVAAILGFLAQLLVRDALVVVLLLVLIPVMLVAVLAGAAALNTFLWHYWTVAYLRMSRRPVVAAATIAEPPIAPETA